MSSINRRAFLQRSALAATSMAVGRAARAGATVTDLPAVGKIRPRASAAIAASPFSVGFETLDRKMFAPERTYAHLAQLGAKWARVHTGWCRTELAPGTYDFAWLDSVVDSLRKIGIQPWFCVGFGNRLYTPEASFESAVGWIPTGTPQGKAAWLRYVEKLAEHYRGRVTHFEIWNEPNGKSFWRPNEPNPGEYVEFVKLTAPIIRQRIPAAVIIGGAIAGMETKFFQASMESGLGQCIDKASFHSYRTIPEKLYAEDLKAWRKIVAKHRPGIGLWHGEIGAASQPGGAGGRANYPWTELRQAKFLLRRFLFDLRLKTELISYFHTVDLVNYGGADGPTGKTNFKGLLRGVDYTPKPAYFAYQCLCAMFDAGTTRVELPMEFRPVAGTPHVEPGEIVSAAFVRDGQGVYVYWHPPGPEMERADESIMLSIPHSSEARLQNPVLIDPLSAKVYRLPRAVRAGSAWQFAVAPLADHPLLITDESTFPMERQA